MAGLFVFVDLALVEEPLQNSLNDFLVPVAGRLRPLIVFHLKFLRQIKKFLRNAFDEFSWTNAGFRSGFLHLLSVLIDAGQKKYIFAFEPMIPRNHVGQHHLVGVPDMRR